MSPKSTRAKMLMWGIAAVAVLYAVNYIFTPEIVGITKLETFFRPKGELKFESETWKQKQPSSWGERYGMVDDLIRTHLALGRSQQEVEALLGKPDIAAPLDGGEVILCYALASQKDYPARSILFPGRLGNLEPWILRLRFRDGRLYLMEVVPT